MPNVDPIPPMPPAGAIPILKTITFSPVAGEDKMITLALVDQAPYPKGTVNLYYNGMPIYTCNDSYAPESINKKFFATYTTSGTLTLKIYANQAYLAAGYNVSQAPIKMSFRTTDQFTLTYVYYKV